jgi:hypothetical protein
MPDDATSSMAASEGTIRSVISVYEPPKCPKRAAGHELGRDLQTLHIRSRAWWALRASNPRPSLCKGGMNLKVGGLWPSDRVPLSTSSCP